MKCPVCKRPMSEGAADYWCPRPGCELYNYPVPFRVAEKFERMIQKITERIHREVVAKITGSL